MPLQTHIFTHRGKFGDTVGYKLNGKYFLKSLPAKVRRTPASCLAAKDFGKASKQAKIIRHAVPDLPKDYTCTNRLNKLMIEVVNADSTRPKGYKHVLPTNLSKLKGFHFNRNKSISALHSIDKDEEGNIRIIVKEAGIRAFALTMKGEIKVSVENGNTLIIPNSAILEPTLIILQQGEATDIVDVLFPKLFPSKKAKFNRTWTLSPHHRYSFRIPRYQSKSSPPTR